MEAIGVARPLPDQVFDRLVEQISSGSLPAGQRLTQERVARELGVSRLPVHQAFRRLEAEGFVRPAGRRGLEVAPVEPAFVRALYEYRAGIDQVAAGLAARNASAEAAERGRQLIARGRRAADDGDVPALIEADMAFHQLIYELAGNRLILEAMASHWNHTRRVMQRILVDGEHQRRVWRDHAAILDAVCAGEPEAAEHEARAHVERAARWFASELADAPRAGGESGRHSPREAQEA